MKDDEGGYHLGADGGYEFRFSTIRKARSVWRWTRGDTGWQRTYEPVPATGEGGIPRELFPY